MNARFSQDSQRVDAGADARLLEFEDAGMGSGVFH